jgi:hypothetical protein
MRACMFVVLGTLGCSHHTADRSDAAPPTADAAADAAAPVSGCTARTTGFVTDRDVHAEPPLPALPQAGGTLVDPTFGTTILRVTDATDCMDCSVAYSYWPTFNRSSTRLQIGSDGGAGLLYRFDPATLAVSGREPLFPNNAPGGGTPFQEDAIWSGTDPDVLFAHEGARLWAYDVASHQYTLVRDFGTMFPGQYLWQMSRSLDDDVFAFALRDNSSYAYVGYVAWRRSADTILLHQSTSELDEVQVDKDGNFLVVKTGQSGHGVIEVRVADLTTGSFADLTDDAPDFAPGHSDNGRGIVVGADNWTNRYTVRELATPHQLASALDFGNDWSVASHVSFLADDESYVVASIYESGAHAPGLFHDEILAFATDGSQAVRRLAHHRSMIAGYADMPRANISRDGCFIAFTSNWGGGRHDVFVVSLASL